MSGIAEVLSAHWSRSTFTDHKPHVDKCDGCGAVIYTWGDDPIPGGVEPLAAHQAAALAAAGFGPAKDAATAAHKVKRFRGELKSLGKHLDSWESQGHTTATIRFLRQWVGARNAELSKPPVDG